MSDDAQGNQCAVCFDHGDSSGSGRLVKAHEGCIDRLEAERDAWKRLADGMEVERLRQEVERLEAERDATQAKVEGMTLHGVEDLLRDLEAAEAERDRLRAALARLEAERDEWREKANGWRACAEDANGVLFVKRAETAEAERDRLREALERIRDNVGWGDYFACACIAEPDKGHMTCTCAGGLRRIAREALGGHQ